MAARNQLKASGVHVTVHMSRNTSPNILATFQMRRIITIIIADLSTKVVCFIRSIIKGRVAISLPAEISRNA